MTPAEMKFKRMVNSLIDFGIYPSGGIILPLVGRVGRKLNGREMRWREQVLIARGFTYDGEMHMYKWRHPAWRLGPRR